MDNSGIKETTAVPRSVGVNDGMLGSHIYNINNNPTHLVNQDTSFQSSIRSGSSSTASSNSKIRPHTYKDCSHKREEGYRSPKVAMLSHPNNGPMKDGQSLDLEPSTCSNGIHETQPVPNQTPKSSGKKQAPGKEKNLPSPSGDISGLIDLTGTSSRNDSGQWDPKSCFKDDNDGYLIISKGHVMSPQAEDFLQKQEGGASSKSSKYCIKNLLGSGTFSMVFEAERMNTNEKVAIKVVKNKPVYARQATKEIGILKSLMNDETFPKDKIVCLRSTFEYASHICLVFDLLGVTLYDLLKQRQFRGLALSVVKRIILQTVDSLNELAQRGVIHCDLKPENILVVQNPNLKDIEKNEPDNNNDSDRTLKKGVSEKQSHNGLVVDENLQVKVIDLGSATYEGRLSHSYIQSRFYRSPEVLVGIPYDTSIDMWSLGCLTCELFLGLPILPGFQEHDQLRRIIEMIGAIPEWMLDKGMKTKRYFNQIVEHQPPDVGRNNYRTPRKPVDIYWQLKTNEQYVSEQNPENRNLNTTSYFKYTRLDDIIMGHGGISSVSEGVFQKFFLHFVRGILEPDPWKRWTAKQCLSHPFLTHSLDDIKLIVRSKNKEEKLKLLFEWQPPHDPNIARRKLKGAEMSTPVNANKSAPSVIHRNFMESDAMSPIFGHPPGLAAMTGDMTLSRPVAAPLMFRNSPPNALSVNSVQNHHLPMHMSGPLEHNGLPPPPSHMHHSPTAYPAAHHDRYGAVNISAQSFTGAYFDPARQFNVDLGVALQRPGNPVGSLTPYDTIGSLQNLADPWLPVAQNQASHMIGTFDQSPRQRQENRMVTIGGGGEMDLSNNIGHMPQSLDRSYIPARPSLLSQQLERNIRSNNINQQSIPETLNQIPSQPNRSLLTRHSSLEHTNARNLINAPHNVHVLAQNMMDSSRGFYDNFGGVAGDPSVMNINRHTSMEQNLSGHAPGSRLTRQTNVNLIDPLIREDYHAPRSHPNQYYGNNQ